MVGRNEEANRAVRISAELWQVLDRHRWRIVATVAVLLLERIIDAFSQSTLPATLPPYLLVGYAQKTFSHLHAPGPRFHARRKLGSLMPDIDRGTSGIAFLLGIGLFTIVPTLVEITLLTFLVYAGFTLVFTARRVVFQRRVNKRDSTAKGRLAGSLINCCSSGWTRMGR